MLQISLLANKSRFVATNSSVPRIPIDRSTMDHSDQEENSFGERSPLPSKDLK